MCYFNVLFISESKYIGNNCLWKYHTIHEKALRIVGVEINCSLMVDNDHFNYIQFYLFMWIFDMK